MSTQASVWLRDDKSEYSLLSLLPQDDAPHTIYLLTSADFAAALKKRLPKAKISGDCYLSTEITPTRLTEKLKHELTDFLLPPEKERYDYIIVPRLLEFAPDPSFLIARYAKALKPAGAFLTTHLNLRYWRILDELKRGSFRFFDRHMYARSEAETIFYASFFKEVFLYPLTAETTDDPDSPGTAAIKSLSLAGWPTDPENLTDYLARFWLIDARPNLPEIAALKEFGTEKERQMISSLLRRLEYDIDLSQSSEKLWQMVEEYHIFPDYLADFTGWTTLNRDKVKENLALNLENSSLSLQKREFRQNFYKKYKENLTAAAAIYDADRFDLPLVPSPNDAKGILAPLPSLFDTDRPSPKTIAFIVCVNDTERYTEMRRYLAAINIPLGWQVKHYPIHDAASMAAGYETARQLAKKDDASIYVYLHQDVLIVNKNLISDLSRIFASQKDIGLIGVIGCRRLPLSGIWWEGRRLYGKVLHACEPESISLAEHYKPSGSKLFQSVEALDGLFLAARGEAFSSKGRDDYDIPWRADLFDGWHFYDASICREYWRRNKRVVVAQQEKEAGFWCIHMPKEKPLAPEYHQYRHIFLKEYGTELKPEV